MHAKLMLQTVELREDLEASVFTASRLKSLLICLPASVTLLQAVSFEIS